MKPYLWMLAGAFSFASMGALSRQLSDRSDWRLLALVRAGLMLVFSLIWARSIGVRLQFLGTPMLWMRSIVGSLGMLFTFYSLTHLPVSEAITLLNIYPIWVALLAWALGARPSAGSWTAIAVGLLGVAFVARPHFDAAPLALLVAISSSVCTAVVLHGLNRLSGMGTWVIIVHFALISTLVCGGAFLFSGTGVTKVDLGGAGRVAQLLGVGLLGTLGQVALTRAFAAGDPSKVSVVGLSQLIFGGAYDALLFDRRHGPLTLLGMALVAAPTAWLLVRAREASGGSGPPPAAAASPRG
jgi:drug/metabolite transporter (DMT)-like permease